MRTLYTECFAFVFKQEKKATLTSTQISVLQHQFYRKANPTRLQDEQLIESLNDVCQVNVVIASHQEHFLTEIVKF